MKNASIRVYHVERNNLRAVSKRLPMTKRTAQSRKAEAEKKILKIVLTRLMGAVAEVKVACGPVVALP